MIDEKFSNLQIGYFRKENQEGSSKGGFYKFLVCLMVVINLTS